MKINNKEDLKQIQIVCKNKNDVKECINILEQIGLEQVNNIKINDENLIVAIGINNNIKTSSTLIKNYAVHFFNKKLIKMLNNIEENLEDFKIAEDGRIIKVNNWKSDKQIFIPNYYENSIKLYLQEFIKNNVNCGLIFATEEARDKAMFKLEIETKLKNIAERLNNGKKIDWENRKQEKCCLIYDMEFKQLICDTYYTVKRQGQIYCISDKFLDEAKKEIGEENLIKYFTEE